MIQNLILQGRLEHHFIKYHILFVHLWVGSLADCNLAIVNSDAGNMHTYRCPCRALFAADLQSLQQGHRKVLL